MRPHLFAEATGIDVMDPLEAAGAIISPYIPEICRPLVNLVKCFNHLFDNFKICRPKAVVNVKDQLLLQRSQGIEIVVIFFVLVLIRILCQPQCNSNNLFDKKLKVMPVAFCIRSAVIRHVIQTGIVVPVAIA